MNFGSKCAIHCLSKGRIRAHRQRLASAKRPLPFANSFSSLARHLPEEFAAACHDDDDDHADHEHPTHVPFWRREREELKEAPKHCTTCTCPHGAPSSSLPPPLPEPKYSVRRRVLPANLIALNSAQGRRMLIEAMTRESAAPYIMLTEHFCNQSDPAFCGVTTLLIVLNALAVDPMVRWKGGWRYFGDETVLLSSCCLPAEYVRRVGVTMEQLQQMAVCHGLQVQMERPHDQNVDLFRTHIREFLQHENKGIVVVSYSRSALGQTGEGHFSPLAAYHESSDQVLILDVARFKYQPYWVPVSVLYEAMTLIDKVTSKPRGWYLMRPPLPSSRYKGLTITSEERRPASLVPLAGQGVVSLCPLHPVKIDFCQANRPRHGKLERTGGVPVVK